MTSLAAANAAGEKLTMFVIGKAKNPMCFENIQFYHVDIGGRKKVDRQCIVRRVGEINK